MVKMKCQNAANKDTTNHQGDDFASYFKDYWKPH